MACYQLNRKFFFHGVCHKQKRENRKSVFLNPLTVLDSMVSNAKIKQPLPKFITGRDTHKTQSAILRQNGRSHTGEQDIRLK